MVGKIEVLISLEVILFLDELINKLYHKEYFGFIDAAESYVDKIYDFIENSIHNFPHKKTPKILAHLGSYYIFYKSNSRTTWYVFFEQESKHYYVSGILNNHCHEASALKLL